MIILYCFVGHMNHTDSLKALVELNLPISETIARMSQFAWDSDEYLAVLTPENLEKALKLFAAGTISAEDIEKWANALECRDDLALSEPAVSKVLFELANPLLTHSLSTERVAQLLSTLKHAS